MPPLTGQNASVAPVARPLAELVEGLCPPPPDLTVTDLTLDSRQVVPGGVFLALRGRTQHGLEFAPQALVKGASAVLYESEPGIEALLPRNAPGVVCIAVPQLSRSVGLLAARFFGAPSEALRIAGITGTNGKTTCAWLLAQALQHCGGRAAYLGTLGFGIAPQVAATEHTTPDAVSVQRLLAVARAQGAGWASLEVSSHALDQGRVSAVRFETAAFTNLTRDHLDYHGTMEAYGAAKARLLAWPGLSARVINIDDPFGAQLAALPSSARTVLTTRRPLQRPWAHGEAAVVRAAAVTAQARGLLIDIESTWGKASLAVRLIGGFNVDNVLTVLGLLLASDIPLGEAANALERCQAASGRMEMLGGEGRPLAVVDYAHTPDALEKALTATGEHCPGRLHVVFGCGGDRDRGKRAQMGRIAEHLADEVTLTDDNPRTEDPRRIVGEILEGIAQPSAVHIEHDRERAIRRALERSQPGDAVLIAGKGHEDYQIYGSTRRIFSDQAVVRAAFGDALTTLTMQRTLTDLAASCGGELRGADRPYGGVSSDSRSLSPGDVFVALKGPRFDGNAFVAAAAEAGAAAAIVDAQQPVALAQIVVPDTQVALERAGRAWREQFAIPVIGVAGSNGKTTTKEMTAAILAQAGSTLATRGNLNNHIGVPLTLLRIEPSHRFAVIEIGTNHPGEVAALVAIARPTVGLITNAGAEHLEGFGSLSGVARAEGEMVEGLSLEGTAILNADDEFAPLWRGMTRARIVSFGLKSGADFTARALTTTLTAEGFLTRFQLCCPQGTADIELHTGARHNVVNALAAAAAAVAAGAHLEHIVAGLRQVRPVAGRLQVKQAASGAAIIDDSYNANPSSMEAAIEVLAETGGTRWLVIGDMAELGEHGPAAHIRIGSFAREHGIERLYATGQLAALAAESYGRGAQWFPDTESLGRALLKDLCGAPADVRLLVKGSRMNRLERVVSTLVHGEGHLEADGH